MDGPRIEPFLAYHSRVRQRTDRLLPLIPPDRLEWSYTPGKFTLGDLVRHLAATERFMWAENALGRPNRYPGHGPELASGYEGTMTYYQARRDESRAIFRGLNDEDMAGSCVTPAGNSITLWKWLRAMLEHEIHHRGQLYTYLGALGVTTPPIFGLPSEALRTPPAD